MGEVTELLNRLGELDEAPLIWVNKKVFDMAEEIERLQSIIKEVREWLIEKKETIERFEIYKRKETGAFWYTTLGEIEKYLEILDKVGETDVKDKR